MDKEEFRKKYEQYCRDVTPEISFGEWLECVEAVNNWKELSK